MISHQKSVEPGVTGVDGIMPPRTSCCPIIPFLALFPN